jgi:anion-transporting  ArsA/GET3 family ATPase
VSPFGERFLFVTGKGGVGKTTIAASLARMRSRAGERVLLAVTDPAAYREVLPGARFEADPIAHEARFYTVHVEAETALKEYGRLLIKPRLARQALFDNRYVQGFLTALPGLPQWAVLGKAWYHTTETSDGVPRFDGVIFDAPATGHAVDLLRLPHVITELAPASILRRDAELAWQMLRDPRQSSIVLVSLPEELPTNETIELAERIAREVGLPVGAVLQNRVRELVFSDAERDALARIPPIESAAPADTVVEAAAARAIRERAQLDSRERLARLRLPSVLPQAAPPQIVELPDLDAALSGAQQVDVLARALTSAAARR